MVWFYDINYVNYIGFNPFTFISIIYLSLMMDSYPFDIYVYAVIRLRVVNI